MRKLIAILLALATVVGTYIPAHAGTVKDAFLYVYAPPWEEVEMLDSPNGDPIMELPRGTQVKCLGQEKYGYRVQYEDCVGYIPEAYLVNYPMDRAMIHPIKNPLPAVTTNTILEEDDEGGPITCIEVDCTYKILRAYIGGEIYITSPCALGREKYGKTSQVSKRKIVKPDEESLWPFKKRLSFVVESYGCNPIIGSEKRSVVGEDCFKEDFWDDGVYVPLWISPYLVVYSSDKTEVYMRK